MEAPIYFLLFATLAASVTVTTGRLKPVSDPSGVVEVVGQYPSSNCSHAECKEKDVRARNEKRWIDSLSFAGKRNLNSVLLRVKQLCHKVCDEPEPMPQCLWSCYIRTYRELSPHPENKRWLDSLAWAKRHPAQNKRWFNHLAFQRRSQAKDAKGKEIQKDGNQHEKSGATPTGNDEKRWLDNLAWAKRRNLNQEENKRWVDSLAFQKKDIENGANKRWLSDLGFQKKDNFLKPAQKSAGKRRSRRWVDEMTFGKRSDGNRGLGSVGIQKRWVDELHFGKREGPAMDTSKRWIDNLHFTSRRKRGFDDILELCVEKFCVGFKGPTFDRCSVELCIRPMMPHREAIENQLQRRTAPNDNWCEWTCQYPYLGLPCTCL